MMNTTKVPSRHSLLKRVIWFEKRTKCDFDFYEILEPQRKVSDNPRYKNGTFFSEKCNREIQYESGIELAFIHQLETNKNVDFYYEQPVRIAYWKGRKKQLYTPDFALFLKTKEVVLVEIKEVSGMCEKSVQTKIEALLDYCHKKGFGLLLTDGKNTLDKILKVKCNKKLEQEILQAINNRTLRKQECKAIMQRHQATQNELLKIILKNGLHYKAFPFKLCQGSGNKLFYQVFFQKKRYADLEAARFSTLFK